MKFQKEDGQFDIQAFRRAVEIMILAQEIIVDNSSYPTPEITKVSHDYRTLGLGYANLGALLMACGLPYDSNRARSLSAAITALMTGQAYLTSAEIAEQAGAFEGFDKNRVPTMRVMHKHREALSDIDSALVPMDILHAAMEVWDQAIVKGSEHGFRNAQVTLLAPTGTIAFMMDCDTTGVEPDFSLVKVKTLVGGGTLKIVNNTIPRALKRMGYPQGDIDDILRYIKKNETIEGAPHVKDDHLAVSESMLGALLMACGLPYDSNRARSLSAAITALMTGQAYLTSAEIAEQAGAFEGFDKNRVPTMRVMHKHREALSDIDSALVPMDILHAAMEVWDQAIVKGSEHGFRNAQVTLHHLAGFVSLNNLTGSDFTRCPFPVIDDSFHELVGHADAIIGVLKLNASVGFSINSVIVPELDQFVSLLFLQSLAPDIFPNIRMICIENDHLCGAASGAARLNSPRKAVIPSHKGDRS